MNSDQDLSDQFAKNREEFLAIMKANAKITERILAITASCRDDDQFRAHGQEILALTEEQTRLGREAKKLIQARSALESRQEP
jgi:hypothetical protein